MTARSDHTEQVRYVVDAAGDPIEVGGVCGLYIDLQPEDSAPMRGDWIATEAGSRYLVDDVHLVRRARHAQVKRYRMRCLRLPKDTPPTRRGQRHLAALVPTSKENPMSDETHDSIVHIAGHDVQVGTHLRQRCSWCGGVLIDEDLALVSVQVRDGEEPAPYPTWPVGALIETTGLDGTSMTTVLEHTDGDPVPDHCCAKLAAEVTR